MFALFVAAQIRDEIISSEETYVKELRTLVMVFLRPLEKWVAEGMNGLGISAGEHYIPVEESRMYCGGVDAESGMH